MRGIAAGLHVTVELPPGFDERAIKAAAGERRIVFNVMADYSHARRPDPDARLRPAARARDPRRRARTRRARASTSPRRRRVVDVSPAERFEALYREHYAAVLRFARRRTDPQTAEDVTAETFAIAWRRLDRIPAHKPLPWLYVTAGHELANRRRKAASDRAQGRRAYHAKSAATPPRRSPSATPSCRPSPRSPSVTARRCGSSPGTASASPTAPAPPARPASRSRSASHAPNAAWRRRWKTNPHPWRTHEHPGTAARL